MKTVYLVRHGQTLFNVRKKIQGWCDSPLTQLGIQQAKAVGDYFHSQGITFDQAYASTSERCCDTLEYITNMPYKRLKGLKEWNFGRFEGESEDLNPPLPYGDFFVKYGGESQEDVQNRMAKTLQDMMSQENHQNVLVVSHGASIRNFLRVWEHNNQVEFQGRITNGCILKFAYENNEFTLVDVIYCEINHRR